MAPRTNLAGAATHSDVPEENHRTATIVFEAEMTWDEFHEKVKYLKRRVGSNEATIVRITDEHGSPMQARGIGSF